MGKIYLISVLGLLWTLGFSGCSSTEVNPEDPAAVFQEAQQDFESERYVQAIEKFKSVRNRFPYSHFSALAQLRIGDTYFAQESFLESAKAYEVFTELHPKHEKSDYALFKTGEAYFKGAPENLARDLSSAQSAIKVLETFLAQHPLSEHINSARTLLEKSKNKLAAKELMIGKFYKTRGEPGSAKIRFEKILKKYPNSDSVEAAKKELKDL